MNKLLSSVLMGAGLAAAGLAQAATYTFSGYDTGTYGNVRTATQGGLDVTAWANSTASSSSGAAGSGAGTLQKAYVGLNGSASGGFISSATLGAINPNATNEGTPPNGTAPNHAADNQKNVDVFLLSFTSGPVNLTGFSIGYAQEQQSTGAGTYYNQADIALLAFTGSGPLVLPSTSTTYANLLASGWEIIGNYSNVAQNSSVSGITTPKASSYWMIGAWSDVFNMSGKDADSQADFFKLASITANLCTAGTPGCGPGSTPGVPEPGSMALMTLALGGMLGLRRRKGG